MTKTTPPQAIEELFDDADQPLEVKREMLSQLLANKSKGNSKIIDRLLMATNGQGQSETDRAQQRLEAMIEQLAEGPLRTGTYLGEVKALREASVPLLEILLPDGQQVFAALPNPKQVGKLRRGETVVLDAQAKAVLGKQGLLPRIGGQATLLRRIDAETIEVDLGHEGRSLFRCSEELMEDLDAQKVRPGDRVVVCPHRQMAFCGVPHAEDNGHLKYLDRSAIPMTSIAGDLANPPAYIEETLVHLRREMLSPVLARQFQLRRLRTVFLTGVSGTGKTLSVEVFISEVYALIAEITGLDLGQIPSRVLRMRASQILSKWYGQAEANVDQFFDEVELLGDQKIRGRDGKDYEAPVIVVAEEIDGLTRERGGQDATDDRVQTTILQRLDATARSWRDRLVVVICTSNVPSLIDPAFVRRAGGTIETFGRLSRHSFLAVLAKHVRDIPFVGESDDQDPREAAMRDLTAWLFAANSDSPIVELMFAGSTQPHKKHRRDFLTGSVIERAVQRAASQACRQVEKGGPGGGLSAALLAQSITQQVDYIVDQLTEHNAHHYLNVPKGSRVASVRPIPDSQPNPFDMQRSA